MPLRFIVYEVFCSSSCNKIAFQIIAIAGAKGQVYGGSKEDEPGPTGKMIKHSTSTRLPKTVGRIESFTIAFNRLNLLKKDSDRYFVRLMVIFQAK